MGFNIVTELPGWFILLCIALGALYSYFLYYKEHKFSETPSWMLYTMIGCRFLLTTLLSFLLLGPLIKILLREVEKPIVIVAQDNSESIVINKDSSYYKGDYVKNFQNFIDQLNDQFEVKTYSFGHKISESINFSFDEKQTDMDELFSEIETRYSNRNMGAIVIASDGLYNKGISPLYSSGKAKTPIYTVALGDTSIKKDLILNKVEYNRITYLGNKFPLQIVVDAKELKGKSATLTITKGEEKLYNQTISFNNNSFITTINTELEAKQTGKQHYSVKLSRLDGEVTYANNQKEVFIDVLDGRQKILILANAPHPDINAIKRSIEVNQSYEVESELINEFNKPLKQYNLIILHQLPSAFNSTTTILADIQNNNIPVWFIGTNSNYPGLTILNTNNKSNETEIVLSKNFSLFTLSDELKRFVKNLPAIQTPFGNYQTSASANVLLYQKIGMVETQTPIMLFTQDGEIKTGLFVGDGLWKWKLRDYAENKTNAAFDELVTKTVQYLSVKVDKSFFRIVGEHNFNENETVELEAELYNDSYELINEPDVSINIVNKDNKKFPYTFSKTTNSYKLNAGIFPIGEYRYEAKTKVGEKIYIQTGEFTVDALTVEATNTIADHQLLYMLAQKHNGQLFYSNEFSQLAEVLKNKEDIKSISHSEKKLSDLINLKWFFFLLLALLSLEWFFRKWNGSY